MLALLTYWSPWVAHRAAALELSGQDLGEFAKFVPGIQDGQVSPPRQLFYLPPLACSLCLVLLAASPGLAYRRWLRIAMLALAVVSLTGLLPPVWGGPRDLFTPEFRLQGLALTFGLLVALGHGALRRLPSTALAASVLLLALVALVPTQWAFWTIRPQIWAAYGTSTVHVGWGIWANVAAWVATAILAAGMVRRS